MHTLMSTYAHTHRSANIHEHANISKHSHTHVFMHTHECIHTYAQTHKCAHTHMHTVTCIQIHTNTFERCMHPQIAVALKMFYKTLFGLRNLVPNSFSSYLILSKFPIILQIFVSDEEVSIYVNKGQQ